jgi:hypothetical protein
MYTYRWSFLSVRYLKLLARTTSTVLQAAHCCWRCPHYLWIVLLTVQKLVGLVCLLSVSGLIGLIAVEIWWWGTEVRLSCVNCTCCAYFAYCTYCTSCA